MFAGLLTWYGMVCCDLVCLKWYGIAWYGVCTCRNACLFSYLSRGSILHGRLGSIDSGSVPAALHGGSLRQGKCMCYFLGSQGEGAKAGPDLLKNRYLLNAQDGHANRG